MKKILLFALTTLLTSLFLSSCASKKSTKEALDEVETKIPCYKKKKICDFQTVTNCYEKVAFDSITKRYYSRQNFGVPFDGSCATCHRNGVLEQSITFIEGRRNGTDTSYYPSGCPYSSQSFLLGNPHGKSTTYFDSTFMVKTEIEHYMGQVHGIYLEKDAEGDTLKFQEFANNIPNGVKKEYYSDSKLKKISHYQNGLLHGSQIKFAENGNKELSISYYEGKKDGDWTYYFDNQKIARSEQWDKGIKDGEFKTFNNSEVLISEQYYKKDKPIGTHIERDQNGDEKHVQMFSKKGFLEEEYIIDDYNLKQVIKKRETKAMKKKKKKAKEKDNSLMN